MHQHRKCIQKIYIWILYRKTKICILHWKHGAQTNATHKHERPKIKVHIIHSLYANVTCVLISIYKHYYAIPITIANRTRFVGILLIWYIKYNFSREKSHWSTRIRRDHIVGYTLNSHRNDNIIRMHLWTAIDKQKMTYGKNCASWMAMCFCV